MGGLVVKKVSLLITPELLIQEAIIIAHQDSYYSDIGKNFKGVIFLGTPHRGADLAKLLSALLTAAFSQTIFVEQLRPNSEAIQDINTAFLGRSLDLELVSFFESKEMRGLGVESINE